MIKSFLIGAIAGGAAVWLYGDRILEIVDDLTGDLRNRAASGLDAAASRLTDVAETVSDGLSGSSQQRVS